MLKAIAGALVISLILNVVVAVGNWNLYGRVEKLEATAQKEVIYGLDGSSVFDFSGGIGWVGNLAYFKP